MTCQFLPIQCNYHVLGGPAGALPPLGGAGALPPLGGPPSRLPALPGDEDDDSGIGKGRFRQLNKKTSANINVDSKTTARKLAK